MLVIKAIYNDIEFRKISANFLYYFLYVLKYVYEHVQCQICISVTYSTGENCDQ